MVLLAALLIVLAVILGESTLIVLWPLTAIAAAVLYCLDRPARRTAWPVVAVAMIAAGIAFYLAVGDVDVAGTAVGLVVIVPLLVAASIVLFAGGPARIKQRHELAEAQRRRLRAEAVAQRRQDRKDSIKQRTGLDVDLVSGVARERASRVTKAVGGRITKRLERNRPRAAKGDADWLDLDQDVSAQASRAQRDEIRRLASELDESTGRPRPRSG